MVSTKSFRGARVIRFGEFELDVRAAELRRAGDRVKLQEQPFRILTMLLEHPGEIVLREDIRRKLWPNGTIVEVGHGINAAVLRLREALGESAGNPRFIETLARRGYRFAGAADVVGPERGHTAAPVNQVDTAGLDGQTISHFRVVRKLGGGGMGVVYQADDLKLGRQVALKFLPPDLCTDPSALGRFQREARAASALNHPNICTIYSVEEYRGQPVIVMEMLEGDTLEARLARGPLPVSEVLVLASQMAGALDTAHRRGIVHRDLKPANVFLTPAGMKLLDFGLAKMAPGAAKRPEGEQVTREGAILGTLHYMSPEQVKGHDADISSDIFSFGLVLYEMLAGHRAFPGENSATVMAAILTLDPPAVRHRDTPPGLDVILRRCLAKEPAQRWHSASDLKAALDCIAAAPPAAPPKPGSRWMYVLLAAAAIAGLLAFAWSGITDRWEPQPQHAAAPSNAPPATVPGASTLRPIATRSGQPAVAQAIHPATNAAAVTRFTVWPPGGGNVTRLALSPDGRSVAFTSGGRLFVRAFDSLEPHELPGGDGAGTPFWSSDGRTVAFTSRGELKSIRLPGDPPLSIGKINTNMRGAWSAEGTVLIGAIADVIYRIPAAGAVATPVTRLDTSLGETRHMLPQFLPGGKRFLYIAGTNGTRSSMLYAGSLDSANRTAIMPVSSSVEFVSASPESLTGYLIFVKDRMLQAQPFDAARLRTTGESFTVAGPIMSVNAVGTDIGVGDFSTAAGTLAYRSAGTPEPTVSIGGNVVHPAPARKDVGNIIVVQNWLAGLRR